MKLIIDANILVSAIISRRLTFDLIQHPYLHLYAPTLLITEINRNKDEIIRKSCLEEHDFEELLILLINSIEFIEDIKYIHFMKEAEDICPDHNDTAYFALAMFLRLPLWSNDKLLKSQDAINVYSTDDLLRSIR